MLTERRKRSLAKMLVFSLALAGSACQTFAEWKVGDSIPDFASFNLEGKLPDCSGKVLLIDFWASWCGPCAQSFPAMESLQKKYAEQGFQIVAISVDEKQQAMEKFLKKTPASFAVVRDASQKLVEKAGVSTMPGSFLVDQTGKVRFMHSGYHGKETQQKYEQEIESLLKK